MMKAIAIVFSLVVTGVIVVAVGRAEAQTVANGPYYVAPSWDQTLTCTSPTSCPRFVVLSNFDNAAVLDRETGLVWERSPSSETFEWSSQSGGLASSAHCLSLSIARRKGWRLPTINELASLVETPNKPPSFPPEPALPAGHPFQDVIKITVGSPFYWSATTEQTGTARFVNFESGSVGTASKSLDFLVWCVRGGQVVDPQ